MAGSLAAGTYTVTVTDANGCTETQSATVTEPTALASTLTSMNTLCNGSSDGSATVSTLGGTAPYSYTWSDGQTTAMAGSLAAGSYTVTVTDANGCTETQSTTVLEPNALIVDAGSDVSVCIGDFVTLSGSGALSYTWDNGVIDSTAFLVSATGTYTVTGTDVNGCVNTDSVLVTVNQDYYNVITIGACTGDSIYAGGNYQTTSGIFVDSLQSINGCDSIVETNLNIASQIVVNIPLNICFGDSALINGNFETASGTFYDTSSSVAGCDSVTVTNFMVDSLITNSIMATVCFGDSLMVGGSYQTVSGVYVDTLITSAGCDSVVSTNFMIDSLIANSVMASICNGDSLLVGGAYQSAAGNYVDTLSTSSGCDSLVTTTLTVNTTLTSTDVQQAACDYTWIDGITYTTSDSLASYTLSSVAGCDSVVTLNLTISAIVTTIVQNVNDIEASATNGTAPYSYGWNTGETTASITPAVNGTYWVVVTDNDTCYSDTASFDVTFVSGTGIDNWNNSVSIYPNPTSDVVTISTGNYTGSLRANVYDLFGRKVFTSNNKEISLKSFADGVYILEVKAADKTYTTRIIKE